MPTERDRTPLFPIGVAERLTGLTARQIRYWEANELLQPARTRGRQRLYSESDITRLKEIKRMMGEGMSLTRVKRLLTVRDNRTDRADAASAFMERGGRVPSLYPLRNRDALMRLIDRDDT